MKRVQEEGCSVSFGQLEAFCEVDFCGQSEERVRKIAEKFIMLFAFPCRDVDYFFCVHNYVVVKLQFYKYRKSREQNVKLACKVLPKHKRIKLQSTNIVKVECNESIVSAFVTLQPEKKQ